MDIGKPSRIDRNPISSGRGEGKREVKIFIFFGCCWGSRSAWRNEVSAPELLTLDESLVTDLMQQLENQQDIVDDAR